MNAALPVSPAPSPAPSPARIASVADLPAELRAILREARDALAEDLGDDLDRVLLFGSQARGEARDADSDIDLLCVMRGPFDLGDVMDRTSEKLARICLDHTVLIANMYVTRKDYETRRSPFLVNVRKDAIEL